MAFVPGSASELAVQYGAGITVQRSILVLALDAALFLTVIHGLCQKHRFERLSIAAACVEVSCCIVLAAAAIWSSVAEVGAESSSEQRPAPTYSILHAAITSLLCLQAVFHKGVVVRDALSVASLCLAAVCSIGLLHSVATRVRSRCAIELLAGLDGCAAAAMLLLALLHLSPYGASCTPPSAQSANTTADDSTASVAAEDGYSGIDDSNASGGAAPVSRHDEASWLSVALFSFLNPMFNTGFSRQLNMADLEAMPKADSTTWWAESFEQELSRWHQERNMQKVHSIDVESRVPAVATPRTPLFAVIMRVFFWQWAALGFLQAGCVAMAMISPLFLNKLLGFIEAASSDPASNPWLGLLWAMLLALTQVGAALFTTQFCYWFTRLQLRLRSALVAAVYRGMLTSPLELRRTVTSGQITNFLSVDIQKLQDVVPSFHQFWSLPIQVAITLYLLYTQVQWAFSAGLVVLVVFVPLNMVVSKRIGTLTGVMMKCRDERVRITGELLAGIRVVKMQAWEVPMLDRIHAARALELKALRSRKYLDAVCVFLWASTPVLIALATFTAVVVFVPAGGSATLSASAVFTTISLLNLLIFPMNAFPWVLTGVLEAWVSLKRLQTFLCHTDADAAAAARGLFEPEDAPPYAVRAEAASMQKSVPLLSVNGSFRFLETSPIGNDDSTDADPTSSISEPQPSKSGGSSSFELSLRWRGEPIAVYPSQLVTVCGPIGAGKSAVLAALLRDMVSSGNAMMVSRSTVGTVAASSATGTLAGMQCTVSLSADCTFSYAPQSPWIRGASLKDNIVFGSTFDQKRYARVIHACCLESDIATLAQGDDTIISDTTLSGGQQQRVNLARALYASSSLVLLDDPLSALDARIASSVWTRALAPRTGIGDGATDSWALSDAGQLSFLAADGRACLLVTHDHRYIGQAHSALVLQNGRVLYWGSPRSMPQEAQDAAGLTHGESSATATAQFTAMAVASTDAASRPNASTQAAAAAIDLPPAAVIASPAGKDDDEAQREEAREAGVVKGRVVMTYIRAVGIGLSLFVLAAMTIMQISRNGSDWWLSIWSAAASGPGDAAGASASIIRMLSDWDNKQFLLVYGLVAAVNVLATVARSWSFAAAGIKAAINVHEALLSAVAFAPMAFHDVTPPGRLLNRFSADQYAIDETLPFQLNIFLAQAYGMAGTMLVLAYSTSGIFLAAMPPLAYLYFLLQRRYRATSRELKRLDSVTRSPLFSQFGDSLEGSAVIRAQSVNRGNEHAHAVIDGLRDDAGLQSNSACERESALTLQLLDASQRTSFTAGMASQWLQLRLQAVGTILIGIVALVAALSRIFNDSERASVGDDAGCMVAPTPIQHIANPTPDLHDDGGDGGAAGIAGLSLSYAIPIVGALQSLVSAFAETEKEMVSVERAREYVDVQPEETADAGGAGGAGGRTKNSPKPSPHSEAEQAHDSRSEHEQPLLDSGVDGTSDGDGSGNAIVAIDDHTHPNPSLRAWRPTAGAVSFQHLTVQYPGTLRPAISDLNLAIEPGTKIGICGRTGSGKSTIVSSLWRLVLPKMGSIFVDGVNVSRVPLAALRSSMAIVPQEPLLFNGTVRYNLDPAGENTDDRLLEVLRDCQLAGASSAGDAAGVTPASEVTSANAPNAPQQYQQHEQHHVSKSISLDAAIEDGGRNWSVGERQLLCLGRALLKRSKIIAVDEATAATDGRTEALIQSVLSRAFQKATVILIAHRVSTLLACDRIVVMSEGTVVETGSPTALASSPDSQFAQLLRAGAAAL